MVVVRGRREASFEFILKLYGHPITPTLEIPNPESSFETLQRLLIINKDERNIFLEWPLQI